MGKSIYDKLGIPKRFRKKFFKTLHYYVDENSLKRLKDYVEHFEEFKKQGAGLLLICEDGINRTLVASALLREIYDRYEVEGKYLDADYHSIKTIKSKGMEALDTFLGADFLVINHLGINLKHDWFAAFILEILKGRYENLKPTVVITPYIPSYQSEDYDFMEKLSEEELEDAPGWLLNGKFYTDYANEIVYYLSRLTTPVEVKKPAEVIKELENTKG